MDGASLRRIAEDADSNIGMVYYYFRTKDDLFLAVVEDVYSGLMADMNAALAGPEVDPEAKVEALFRRVAAMSETEFTVVRILVREALGTSSRLQGVIELFSQGHVPLVARAVAQGVAAGAITNRQPVPVTMMALAALGALPQVVRRILLERVPAAGALVPDADTLAQYMLRTALVGLRAGGD